ncbi:hypothetical protein LQZ18_06895 [Lachnospiraceae bacterium ZAX-1]
MKQIRIKDLLNYFDAENIKYRFRGATDLKLAGFSSLKNSPEQKNLKTIDKLPKF